MPVDPHNDQTIEGDDWLIRRVPNHSVRDNVVSKSCYASSRPPADETWGCSCDLGSALPEWDGTNISDSYFKEVKAIVAVKVESVRGIEDLMVGKAPVDGNAAHCNIWHVGPDGKPKALSDSKQKALHRASVLIRPRDGSVEMKPYLPPQN